MRKIFFSFFLIVISSTIIIGQPTPNILNQQQDDQNFLQNQSLSDSKKLRQYYQNIYQNQQSDVENLLSPSFQVDKAELLETLKELIPQDGPVNPDTYLVGPGDFLQINIWNELGLQIPPLQVSPEGNIVIPNYGIIEVKGSTLREVKEKIKEELSKDFINGEITTTLYLPRIFAISVSGVVKNPGTYYGSGVQRVDQAIYLANLEPKMAAAIITQQQAEEKEKLNRPDYIDYIGDENLIKKDINMSLRNIQLIRSNGDTLIVDLVRYYATGDKKYNPYLNEGDRIIVPNQNLNGNSLTIQGAVKLEGTFEYNENDSLSAMMALAQGATAIADLKNVELFRLNKNNGQYDKIVIDFNELLKDKTKDIPLKADDRVVVREIYPRVQPQSIVIKGEVVKPGLYPIIKNKTTLTNVIEMAGGFTNNATLREARIIRFPENMDNTLNNADYERLFNLRLSTMDEEDRYYYNLESAIKRNFVSVSLHDLFVENDSTQNIVLEDGDVILIPEKSNSIYVYGQIARPGYLDYKPGADYDYYIEIAGGTTEMAKESDISIVKAGTRNWLEPGDTEIQPGDMIFIPREKETDFAYYFSWFSQIVSVIGGVATIIILLRN